MCNLKLKKQRRLCSETCLKSQTGKVDNKHLL